MSICLHLSHCETAQGLHYQQLEIELTNRDRIIVPQVLADLELPSGIDTTKGIVLSGRAPIWLYSYLVHECHPTAWVACYDPRMGAVVVSTHSHQTHVGQVLALQPSVIDGAQKGQLCPALLVVGPPDSGKSILSHALLQALLPQSPHIYLQRANWDGEGNYILELPQNADPEPFKAANKGGMTDRFFPYHAQALLNLRRQKSLVIVDIGGRVQPEKQPVLEACTHYLMISAQPDAIAPWHEFCRDRGNLTPVAVIHSALETCEHVQQREPYLEMTCGAWIRERPRSIPHLLLERIQALLLKQKAV